MYSKLLLVVVLAAYVYGQSATKSYPGLSSSNINEFQLNGQAASINPNSDNTFRLTSSGPSLAGSIFLKEAVALTGPNGFKASFSTVFSFSMPSPGGIGDEDGAGADGLVFVVNAISNNVGSVGGGMGYSGVLNSIGIEFDTYNNGEISGNHIGIDLNGNINSVQNAHYPTRMNSGTVFYAWVEFNGDTKVIEVRISTSSTRPASAFLSRTVDLVSILGTPNVYVGFSAATGSGYNVHQIHSWVFTNTYVIISQCGNAILEAGEVCDGGACCKSDCSGYLASGTTCRASVGPCDVEEVCSGSSQSCPVESFQPNTVTCRASNGACDAAEKCTGSSGFCPTDSFLSSSTTCRASNGVCDIEEKCPGNSASCPADSFQSSATTCRNSNGPCDLPEFCTGSTASCPADSFSASTVTCRASNGICDVVEQCTGSDAACPSDSFALPTQTCRVSIGQCDAEEKCTGTGVTCPADLSGAWETDCLGLNFNVPGQATSFLSYDVISFNNFVGSTGNVEGRVAVKNDVTVGWGWSVGSSTGKQSGDTFINYAIVAGGNVNWASGEIYPHNYPTQMGPVTENLFAGGQVTGADYILERQKGNCSTPGCLAQEFEDARSCYAAYQNAYAAKTDNVQKVIQWSELALTCDSNTASEYVVTIHPAEMTQYTWVSLHNCASSARWVVNIDTTANVVLNGVTITTDGSVIYNVLGSGRTISVGWIQVIGSILAPYNTLDQTGGTITGKVVVGDITKSQNFIRYSCYVPI